MMAPRSTGRPVAYLRRSKVQSDKPGTVSHDVQLAAVKALAGDPRLLVLEDWGVSGQSKSRAKRPGYTELLRLIEANKVSAVYSYSMSRLARSVTDLRALVDLCEEHKVPIITAKHDMDTSTATGRFVVTMLAAVDEMLAEMQAEAQADNLAARREHIATCEAPATCGQSHVMGREAYGSADGEDPSAVHNAYASAGSFLGAVKLLNASGVPTRIPACAADCDKHHGSITDPKTGATRPRGHATGQWDVRTVARMIRHDGLAPASGKRGVAAGRATRLFAQLLKCPHCGSTLTSMPRAGGIAYYCAQAHRDPAHPRPYVVAERFVRPWAEAAIAARLSVTITGHFEGAADPADIARRHAGLDGRRSAVVALADVLAPDEVRAKLAAIEAERAEIDESDHLTGLDMEPTLPLSLDGDPGEVNARLRSKWSHIVLQKADLHPLRLVRRDGSEWPE